MSFAGAISNINALTSAAAKKQPDELRAYLAGIIAHIAIQTWYRIEHSGNYIITERSIWVGDTKASTISKVLDNLDRLVDLGKAVVRAAGRAGPKPSFSGDKRENLCVALAYLIDFSTNEDIAGKLKRKRYDIVDFGPLGITPATVGRFGEAYEIKSKTGLKQGREYINRQVGNYNQALSEMKKFLEEGLGLAGLLGGYRLRPGRSYPPSRKLLIVGPNTLTFWLEEPGVILYEWLSFKRLSWKALKDFVKQVQAGEREIREIFETRSSLKPEVIVMFLTLGAMGVFVTAMIALGLGLEAGGLLTALPRLATAGGLGLPSLALAQSSPQTMPINSAADAARVNEVLSAFNKMPEPDLSFLTNSYRPPAPTDEKLPGGTPQTSSEQSLFKLVDLLVSETVFLYSVQVGQGDELLDENNLGILKKNLATWIGSFLSVYGLNKFLDLTGQPGSEQLNEETAIKIGEVIVAAARGNLDNTLFGRFIASFFSLSEEDVEDSLPLFYNDDGEI